MNSFHLINALSLCFSVFLCFLDTEVWSTGVLCLIQSLEKRCFFSVCLFPSCSLSISHLSLSYAQPLTHNTIHRVFDTVLFFINRKFSLYDQKRKKRTHQPHDQQQQEKRICLLSLPPLCVKREKEKRKMGFQEFIRNAGVCSVVSSLFTSSLHFSPPQCRKNVSVCSNRNGISPYVGVCVCVCVCVLCFLLFLFLTFVVVIIIIIVTVLQYQLACCSTLVCVM